MIEVLSNLEIQSITGVPLGLKFIVPIATQEIFVWDGFQAMHREVSETLGIDLTNAVYVTAEWIRDINYWKVSWYRGLQATDPLVVDKCEDKIISLLGPRVTDTSFKRRSNC